MCPVYRVLHSLDIGKLYVIIFVIIAYNLETEPPAQSSMASALTGSGKLRDLRASLKNLDALERRLHLRGEPFDSAVDAIPSASAAIGGGGGGQREAGGQGPESGAPGGQGSGAGAQGTDSSGASELGSDLDAGSLSDDDPPAAADADAVAVARSGALKKGALDQHSTSTADLISSAKPKHTPFECGFILFSSVPSAPDIAFN